MDPIKQYDVIIGNTGHYPHELSLGKQVIDIDEQLIERFPKLKAIPTVIYFIVVNGIEVNICGYINAVRELVEKVYNNDWTHLSQCWKSELLKPLPQYLREYKVCYELVSLLNQLDNYNVVDEYELRIQISPDQPSMSVESILNNGSQPLSE